MKKLRNNMSELPQSVKASIAYFIASIVSSGIAYITTPIYTRMLTSVDYGKASVFFTWSQIFGIIAMFCLSYGVFNNGMVDYPERRDEYSFSMLVLSNVITIIFFIVILILFPFIRHYIGMDLPLLLLMFTVFLVQPAYNFWVARQRYEMRYKATVLWTDISAIVSPVTAIICILLFSKNPLYGRLFGAQGSLIIIYIGFYVYLGVRAGFKLNMKYWKTAFFFNLPLIPHYLSTYLLNSADKLMISQIISNEATAYYSVAYAVASVVTIVWTAANGSLIPYTYEKCKVKNYNAIAKVANSLVLLFSIACVLIILLAPEAIFIMATNDYLEAIYVIPPIVGGVFFQVQYYLYANILYYYKKSQYVMLGSLTAMLLNIVLNYIFINIFGYIASGYTTMICYFVQALIDYSAMKNIVGFRIYDIRFIMFMSVGISVIALFSNLLYKIIIIRYLIVTAIIIILGVQRKRVINIFFNLRKEK